MDFEWLGITVLVISVLMIAVGIVLLIKTRTRIRASIDIAALAENEIGPYTVYGVTAIITATGHGSAANTVLSLVAKPTDETMDTVWDEQTLLLGTLKAGTSRTIETKITIPSGCDIRIKGILKPETTGKRNGNYAIESTEIIVRSQTWNGTERSEYFY